MSEVGKSFAEFLEQNGTVDENGVTSLTLKDYRTFLGDHGVTKDIQSKMTEVETEVTTGLCLYNAKKLTEKVEELKKDGKLDEAKKAEVSTRLTTNTGTRRVRTVASQTYPIPGSTDKCTKTMVVTDTIKMTRSVDKEIVKGLEDEMKKLLGL